MSSFYASIQIVRLSGQFCCSKERRSAPREPSTEDSVAKVINLDAHKPTILTAAFTIDKIILSEYNARSIRAPLSLSPAARPQPFSFCSWNVRFLSPLRSSSAHVSPFFPLHARSDRDRNFIVMYPSDRSETGPRIFPIPHSLLSSFSCFALCPSCSSLATHNSGSTNSMSIVDREHPSSG